MSQKAVEMKNQLSPTPSAEHQFLDLFIGKWNAGRKFRRCE